MPFSHDLAGGQGNLIAQVFKSPNYVPGESGWTVNKDGSAEFNDLVVRGTIEGTEYVINDDGAFFYSPSEGPGNLVMALASSAGTDGYGNAYTAGLSFAAGNGSPVIQVRPDLKALLIYGA